MKRVVVVQRPDGRFVANWDGCVSPTGYGASVAEAIGDFVIRQGLVEVVFNPPACKHEYRIKNPHAELSFYSD